MKTIQNMVLAMFVFVLVAGMATATSMTLVSGADAEYKDGDSWYNAVPLSYLHPSWIANIDTATGDLSGASWMWKTDGVTLDEAVLGSNVMFKHQFNLGCSENFVGTITITTDNAYTLRVNSAEIGTNSDWNAPETYDISGALQSGDNTLVIEATNEAIPGSNPESNPAGVLYRADITYDEKSCGNNGVVVPGVEVPEFNVIAAAVALIGALGIFLYTRK